MHNRTVMLFRQNNSHIVRNVSYFIVDLNGNFVCCSFVVDIFLYYCSTVLSNADQRLFALLLLSMTAATSAASAAAVTQCSTLNTSQKCAHFRGIVSHHRPLAGIASRKLAALPCKVIECNARQPRPCLKLSAVREERGDNSLPVIIIQYT
jgi:hypothetical protein